MKKQRPPWHHTFQPRPCERCTEIFTPRAGSQKFCTAACRLQQKADRYLSGSFMPLYQAAECYAKGSELQHARAAILIRGLRAVCDERGQKLVAELLDVSAQYINDLLHGRRAVNDSVCARILQIKAERPQTFSGDDEDVQ